MASALLGIDFGIGGAKATLIDNGGAVLGYAFEEYPILTPRPGWSEHDAALFCPIACRIIRAVIDQGRVDPKTIKDVTVYGEFVEKHGYGVHHFGVLVDNMEEALERVPGAGFKNIQDGAGFGPDDDRHYAYLDTEDVIGMTIELIERPRRRNPPEKVYPPTSESGAPSH